METQIASPKVPIMGPASVGSRFRAGGSDGGPAAHTPKPMCSSHNCSLAAEWTAPLQHPLVVESTNAHGCKAKWQKQDCVSVFSSTQP